MKNPKTDTNKIHWSASGVWVQHNVGDVVEYAGKWVKIETVDSKYFSEESEMAWSVGVEADSGYLMYYSGYLASPEEASDAIRKEKERVETATPKIKYSPCLALINGINLDLMSDDFKSEWLALVTNLYPEFVEWMATTSPINTKMLLFQSQSGQTLGQAIYKIKKNNRIKICNFYITQSVRACGVGKMFLKSLLALLSVQFPNHQAYATVMRSTNSKYFYVNHGFKIVAETDRGEDVVSMDLPTLVNQYSGYGFLPFTLKYFNDFMGIDERLNTFTGWRYFSRIQNIESFINNRVLLYVSSPAQAIAGEATLCQDMLGQDKAREVIGKDDRALSKSSFLLKDFVFYPRYLDLNNMKNLGAIDRHPQRLVHLEQRDFDFVHRLAFLA